MVFMDESDYRGIADSIDPITLNGWVGLCQQSNVAGGYRTSLSGFDFVPATNGQCAESDHGNPCRHLSGKYRVGRQVLAEEK